MAEAQDRQVEVKIPPIPENIFSNGDIDKSEIRILNIIYPSNGGPVTTSESGKKVRGIALKLTPEAEEYYQAIFEEAKQQASPSALSNSQLEGCYLQNNNVTLLFRPKDKGFSVTVIGSIGMPEDDEKKDFEDVLKSGRFIHASGFVPFSGNGSYGKTTLESLYNKFKDNRTGRFF